MKAILPSRQVRVKSFSRRARIDPCVVITFQAITESNLVWRTEAQGCVVEAYASDAGRDPYAATLNRERSIVGSRSFDVNRRGLQIRLHCLWIYDYDPRCRAKPEPSG